MSPQQRRSTRRTPAKAAGTSGGTALEKRMELLESRFVSPAGAAQSPAASTPTQMMASTPAGYHHHQQQQHPDSTSRSRGTPVRSNRHGTMTIGFPTSSASNGAQCITSPLGTGSAGAGGGLSNHSFAFDQPRAESSRDALLAAGVLGGADATAGAGATSTGAGVSASVREVTMAAERHMAKIGQRLNIPLPPQQPSGDSNGGGIVPLPQPHDCSSASVPASVDGNEMEREEEDCSSNQTMVTGHHAPNRGQGQEQQHKVRFCHCDSNRPHFCLLFQSSSSFLYHHNLNQINPFQQFLLCQRQQPAPASGSKRKSTPSKRAPSIKDATRRGGRGSGTANNANTAKTSAGAPTPQASNAAGGKKNRRKQSSSSAATASGSASNAGSSPALKPINGRKTTSADAGGASRKRSAAEVSTSSSSTATTIAGTTSVSSRDAPVIQTLLGGGAGGSASNAHNHNSNASKSNSLSSWKSAGGGTGASKQPVAPPNNTRIDDFFGNVKKRTSIAGADDAGAASAAAGGRRGKKARGDKAAAGVAASAEEGSLLMDDAALVAGAASAEGATVSKKKKATAASADGPVVTSKPSAAISRELGHYKKRCVDLEGALADRDEKLRAVSNNQTMIHVSLRATLDRREEEVDDLRTEMEEKASAVSETIEKLVRSDAARRAVELRQKLASDGARLGRIVYTRAGMHSVESWEDGQAPRALKNRRKDLREKRDKMEKRQQAALAVANKIRAQAASANGEDGANNDSEMDPVGGIVVQDAFDVMEALESIRLHLVNLKKEEDELEEEEKALVAEKEAHIRALKRVASEDSSQFKHRPKLHDRYVPICQLGKGGFSEVWRAYDLEEMREVAVKIHQLDPRWSDAKKENYTKHVSREYEIHRGVRHPRIVSLFDVFEIDTNSFATVLECCEGTDLDTILKQNKFLPERDARAYLLQILSGMRYLSSPSEDGSRQGIIHYDLKPGNILFDHHGDAKITDFGLSKIVDAPEAGDSMELTSQGAGTYWYLPPECFLTHQGIRISNKVDVWSVGVIFYQMLFGKRPFGDGQSQDHILTNNIMLNARDVRFPSSPQVSGGAKDFIRQCLQYDQTFRPNVAEICLNSYLHADIS